MIVIVNTDIFNVVHADLFALAHTSTYLYVIVYM